MTPLPELPARVREAMRILRDVAHQDGFEQRGETSPDCKDAEAALNLAIREELGSVQRELDDTHKWYEIEHERAEKAEAALREAYARAAQVAYDILKGHAGNPAGRVATAIRNLAERKETT